MRLSIPVIQLISTVAADTIFTAFARYGPAMWLLRRKSRSEQLSLEFICYPSACFLGLYKLELRTTVICGVNDCPWVPRPDACL